MLHVCGLKTRLACAGDYTAQHRFMSAEINLFCYRLQSLSESGIKCFLRQFHQLRKYFLKVTEMLNPSAELAEVRELLSVLDDCCIHWKSVVTAYLLHAREKHALRFTSSNGLHIAVPFHFVQRLVAQRRVLLNKGMALLPPSQLPDLLAAVFRKWLKYGMLLARMWQPHVTTGDDRFTRLFRECRVSTGTAQCPMLCYSLKHIYDFY